MYEGTIDQTGEEEQPLAFDPDSALSDLSYQGPNVLTERHTRLFAIDCATKVLGIFEMAFPGQPTLREALATARTFVEGLATEAELEAAHASAQQMVRMADAASNLYEAERCRREAARARAEDRSREAREYEDEATYLSYRARSFAVQPDPYGASASLVAEAVVGATSKDIQEGVKKVIDHAWNAEIAFVRVKNLPFRWPHLPLSPGDGAGIMARLWQSQRLAYYYARQWDDTQSPA